MQNEQMDDGEWLSALADGQLQGDDFAQAMASVARSDEARSRWHAYHVTGDVLRRADLGDCRDDLAFVARLRSRMAQADGQKNVPMLDGTAEVAVPAPIGQTHVAAAAGSANDAVLRWKWLAAAASFAAVATMGWHLSQVGAGETAQLASTAPGNGVLAATVAQPSTEEPPRMLRDPRLDELLAAHRQLGGTSALQMPAGFLRNATFEQAAR